jgi:hypothetical protein
MDRSNLSAGNAARRNVASASSTLGLIGFSASSTVITDCNKLMMYQVMMLLNCRSSTP